MTSSKAKGVGFDRGRAPRLLQPTLSPQGGNRTLEMFRTMLRAQSPAPSQNYITGRETAMLHMAKRQSNPVDAISKNLSDDRPRARDSDMPHSPIPARPCHPTPLETHPGEQRPPRRDPHLLHLRAHTTGDLNAAAFLETLQIKIPESDWFRKSDRRYCTMFG